VDDWIDLLNQRKRVQRKKRGRGPRQKRE